MGKGPKVRFAGSFMVVVVVGWWIGLGIDVDIGRGEGEGERAFLDGDDWSLGRSSCLRQDIEDQRIKILCERGNVDREVCRVGLSTCR